MFLAIHRQLSFHGPGVNEVFDDDLPCNNRLPQRIYPNLIYPDTSCHGLVLTLRGIRLANGRAVTASFEPTRLSSAFPEGSASLV
jgi:hypothetical protein